MSNPFIAGAGGGGGGCFTGGTQIHTPNGTRPINSLQVGDTVYSFDDTGNIYESEILAVHVHEDEPVSEYLIWGGWKLEATPNHWVLNQFNAFVCIGTLGLDDCLVDENAHLRPILSKKDIGLHTVYNLTVKDRHTFIANGIRVHNAGLGNGLIAGSGGRRSGKSSGGSYQPQTDADSLNSSAYVQILDLLCEGEIEGFPASSQYARGSDLHKKAMLKNIYMDRTPILRESANIENIQTSDYNFNGVTEQNFDVRWGSPDQGYIPGFANTQNERTVGVYVRQGEPVTRSILDTDIDRIRVTLAWDALQKFTDQGDILGTSVQYEIAISYEYSSYITVVSDTVTGRTSDRYQKSYTIGISGNFPVTVKVSRITANSSDSKLQDEFSWISYTEITDVKLKYPGSALLAMQVDAKNFNSIPARSYKIRGMKIRIPNNCVVDQSNGRLIYFGTWDGTFASQQWCADPCWCLWDLLTNCRYGLGQHINSKTLDKWSFYQASVYCNELVRSGIKNSLRQDIYEPRFLCNVSIQTQEEAYKLINDMCSVFRAMPYWSAGSLAIAQDRPLGPTYIFNQANIGEEGFQYSGSSLKGRHSVANVAYLDLEQQDIAYESVEDRQAISKYGIVTAEITAFACTSRSQARRVGEWLLYTEQNESETVTFTTSLDAGIAIRPGMIIATSDPLRAGARRGGKIRAHGVNYIVIDEPLATDINDVSIPSISVAMTDGSIETREVASADGAKITVSQNFTSTPLVGGAFIYNTNTVKMEYWRVLGIEESEGIKYKITALSHDSSKYAYVERGAPPATNQVFPSLYDKALAPENINGQVSSSTTNGQLSNNLALSWQSDPSAIEYEVQYRTVG